MGGRDPEEVVVHCKDCGVKLFSSSVFDQPNDYMPCPDRDECREIQESMTNIY